MSIFFSLSKRPLLYDVPRDSVTVNYKKKQIPADKIWIIYTSTISIRLITTFRACGRNLGVVW